MPVAILNETPLALGFMAGRGARSGFQLTLIVKGTFAISPGAPAAAGEQPLLHGDAQWDEDAGASCRYASDFAPFKPRADVVVTGTCHAPGPRAQPSARVSVRLGTLHKTLIVHGDRHFVEQSFGRHEISEPVPFRSLPLRYESAFGGSGHPANPTGKGHAKLPSGIWPLPNIELPAEPMRTPKDQPQPAGLGPIDGRLPQRTAKLGTYGGNWLSERWPDFPDDMDWGYFNAAPADQQLPYLRGDETFVVEGMHPEVARFESQLPGLRPRCFVHKTLSSSVVIEEAQLRLDTVSIDMDLLQVIVVWRGLVPVRARDYLEVDKALLVAEALGEPARPADHYHDPKQWQPSAPSEEQLGQQEEDAARGAPPETPDPRKEQDEADAAEVAELDQARADLVAAGAEPALLERLKGVTRRGPFLEICLASLPQPAEEERKKEQEQEEQEKKTAEEKLAAREKETPEQKRHREKAEAAAADKAELDGMRAELKAAGAPPALLEKADRATTKFELTSILVSDGLPRPDSPEEERERKQLLASIAEVEAQVEATELAEEAREQAGRGARLTRDEVLALVRLGRSLADTNLTELDLAGVDMHGVNLSGARLTGARLAATNLDGADLTSAVLVRADLTGARLAGVVAEDASFEGASLRGATLSGANMARADLSRTSLEEALLDAVDLTGGKLIEAKLSRANLGQSVLDAADLSGAVLDGVKARKLSLRNAVLTGASFAEAQLDGATLIECRMDRIDLAGASLREAHLEASGGADVSFVGADLTNVRAGGVRFVGGRFARVQGERSSWSGAELTGADFEGALLVGANFSDAQLSTASFHLARLEGANLSKANLATAKLTKVNLFRGRLGGADLTGADCRASNLFECELFETITVRARFDRTNLKRTRLADRSAG